MLQDSHARVHLRVRLCGGIGLVRLLCRVLVRPLLLGILVAVPCLLLGLVVLLGWDALDGRVLLLGRRPHVSHGHLLPSQL